MTAMLGQRRRVMVWRASAVAARTATTGGEAGGVARVAALVETVAMKMMAAVGVVVVMTVGAMAAAMVLNLTGRGGHGRRARMEGVHWCMFGRGHCVLGRGGLRGRIVFEALSAWEGKKGMCGQRMPCVAMGGRRMLTDCG